MADVPTLISEEYERLKFLYQEDIKFSDIPLHIQDDIAMVLRISGEQVWKRCMAGLGIDNDHIEYSCTLRDNQGCAVRNVFNYYKNGTLNSLQSFVQILAENGQKRTLSKLYKHWDDILKAHKRVSSSEKEPDVHDMSIPASTEHNGMGADLDSLEPSTVHGRHLHSRHMPISGEHISPQFSPHHNRRQQQVSVDDERCQTCSNCSTQQLSTSAAYGNHERGHRADHCCSAQGCPSKPHLSNTPVKQYGQHAQHSLQQSSYNQNKKHYNSREKQPYPSRQYSPTAGQNSSAGKHFSPLDNQHSPPEKRFSPQEHSRIPDMADITQFSPEVYDRTETWVRQHAPRLCNEVDSMSPHIPEAVGGSPIKEESMKQCFRSRDKGESYSKMGKSNSVEMTKLGVKQERIVKNEVVSVRNDSCTSSGHVSMETSSSDTSNRKIHNGYPSSAKVIVMPTNPVYSVETSMSTENAGNVYFKPGVPFDGKLPSFKASFANKTEPNDQPLVPNDGTPQPGYDPYAPIDYGNCFHSETIHPMEVGVSDGDADRHHPTANQMAVVMPTPSPCQPINHDYRRTPETWVSPRGQVLSSAGMRQYRNYTLPWTRNDEKIYGPQYRHGTNSGEASLDSLMKSPSCIGIVESCPYSDGMRHSSVFITHLYTSKSPYNKCAISLGRCLKDNNFRIQMDVPNINRVPDQKEWRAWLDHRFATSNYILVCVTKAYLDVVNSTDLDDPDELSDNIQSTRYIYHLMQHEIEENHQPNNRFIPIIFEQDAQCLFANFLPRFLQAEDMEPYMWKRDFENLLFMLDKPEKHLTNFLANHKR